jgi:hypothetical protein
MPYGVRRGIKRPGEFGLSDIFGLSLSSAAGLLAALATDYLQKGPTSALYKINEWAVIATRTAGLGDVPLWSVAASLTAIGALSVFYFQPLTRIGAFARGFSLIAAVMTATPSSLAGGLQAASTGLVPLLPISLAGGAEIRRAPDGIAQASAEALNVSRIEGANARYEVRLVINFPNGAPKDLNALIRQDSLRGRLHNETTGESFNLFLSAGAEIEATETAILIRAGVPATTQKTTLWVRVEAEGYAIELQSAEASLDAPLEWTIDLRPSRTPLVIQRLTRSFWF